MDNNLDEARLAANLPESRPDQKIFRDNTLLHVAQSAEMDTFLKSIGVEDVSNSSGVFSSEMSFDDRAGLATRIKSFTFGITAMPNTNGTWSAPSPERVPSFKEYLEDF